MRNRKTIITAFVLAACLLIGVGYAAVTGMLSVNVSGKFNEFSETSSDVHSAVRFQSAKAVENCTADVTDTTNSDVANMIATFTDTNVEVAGSYTARAEYVIEYTSNVTTLPDATIAVPAIVYTSENPKFTHKIFMSDGTTEWTASSAEVKLKVGETYTFYVELSYAEVEGQAQVENCAFTVQLNYSAQ